MRIVSPVINEAALETFDDCDALRRALAAVPRSAVVGWYETYFAERDTSELEVTAVESEPWTWEVTGVTYEDAVTVRYEQPYTVDGVASDVTGEVHLVPFGEFMPLRDLLGRAVVILVAGRVVGIEEYVAHARSARRLQPDHGLARFHLAPSAGEIG